MLRIVMSGFAAFEVRGAGQAEPKMKFALRMKCLCFRIRRGLEGEGEGLLPPFFAEDKSKAFAGRETLPLRMNLQLLPRRGVL